MKVMLPSAAPNDDAMVHNGLHAKTLTLSILSRAEIIPQSATSRTKSIPQRLSAYFHFSCILIALAFCIALRVPDYR